MMYGIIKTKQKYNDIKILPINFSYSWLSILFFFIEKKDIISQSANIPLDKIYYHLLERYEIKQKRFVPNLFTTVKPYQHIDIVSFIENISEDTNNIYSRADRFNLTYLCNDNWEWIKRNKGDSKRPVFKQFYRKKNDFFHVKEGNFDFHLNPLVHISLGRDTDLSSSTFINTRGIKIRGNIDEKVGFYMFIGENQIRFPRYIKRENNKRRTVAGAGFWKNFDKGGVDFLIAQGYLNWKVGKYFSFEFGHGRHFIGDGYRSLILSDFSNNYLYLKSTLKIWKLYYTILHGSLVADNAKTSNGTFPKKQLAFHRLGINLSSNFSLGLFESIIYSRQDSLRNNAWDIEYFNPIIFYRALEQGIGDADNVSLGLDFKWNIFRHVQFYGQWMIDEMKVKELLSDDGWWGNKFGIQLGTKYIDVLGIRNLDIQMEANLVRPYTYSHFGDQKFTNYQHYDQPLAHPLGANFRELIGIIRYQPLPKINFTAKFFYIEKGEDREGENWGSNIFKSYNSRQQEYENSIGQGVKTTIRFIDFVISYQIKHNFFVDLKHTYRKSDSDIDNRDAISDFTSLSIRWNIGERLWEF